MIALPNPYLLAAGGLALISVAGGGFVYGERYCNGQHATAELKQLAAAQQATRDAENRIAGLEAAAAIREQTRQTTVREITKEVPHVITQNRVVYDRTCIDTSGGKLLDRARDAANGANPGAPAGQASAGSSDRAQP